MSILITGGTGYIGSHTVVELLNAGDKVIIVTYGLFEEKELEGFKPTVIIVDDNNKIIEQR